MSDQGQGVTQVATSAIDALKSNPLCLAAVLLAAMFAVLIYLGVRAERHETNERELILLRACMDLDTPRERNLTP